MRPSEVAVALEAVLPSGRPVYLWGPPGVGTSSVVRQAAARGLELVDVRATLLDPVDLRGLPTVSDGAAVWCPPAFLPRGGKGVFLDELAQAPPLVQAACLQLELDRKLGESEVPPGWSVVAASNRAEDRAGTHRLISPLLNRFVHLDLEVSVDDWQAWAVTANGAPEVRAFVRFRPGLVSGSTRRPTPGRVPRPGPGRPCRRSDPGPRATSSAPWRPGGWARGRRPSPCHSWLWPWPGWPWTRCGRTWCHGSRPCGTPGSGHGWRRAGRPGPGSRTSSGAPPGGRTTFAVLARRDALAVDEKRVSRPAVRRRIALARSKSLSPST